MARPFPLSMRAETCREPAHGAAAQSQDPGASAEPALSTETWGKNSHSRSTSTPALTLADDSRGAAPPSRSRGSIGLLGMGGQPVAQRVPTGMSFGAGRG